MAVRMICSMPMGMSGFSSRGGRGCSLTCFIATETGLSARKGFLPVVISYMTTPVE